MSSTALSTVHPVDEKLPAPRLIALGLQHVLAMYAGAIAVPLIVGRALKLSPEQVALLISADLFACGIVTLIQSLGVGWAMGGPAFLAQRTDVPKLVAMVDAAKASVAEAAASAAASGASAPMIKLGPIPMVDNPGYGALDNMTIAAAVLVFILLLVKYTKGFVANISVLLGIVGGCAVAMAMGKMSFDKVGQAH